MHLKTLQWNIGGAFIRDIDADPLLDESFENDGLHHIIDVINDEKPDLITLQETHTGGGHIQAESIARACGYAHWCNYVHAQSHLEDGYGLGLAIISRFPFVSHQMVLFLNPKFQAVMPNGETWISHDKGVVRGIVTLPDGRALEVDSTHLTPLRRFGIEPFSDATLELRRDVAEKLRFTMQPAILQGDFNFDNPSLREFLPRMFVDGTEEILQEQGTTPAQRKYDHVIYKGVEVMNSNVRTEVLTDHFPIVTMFAV